MDWEIMAKNLGDQVGRGVSDALKSHLIPENRAWRPIDWASYQVNILPGAVGIIAQGTTDQDLTALIKWWAHQNQGPAPWDNLETTLRVRGAGVHGLTALVGQRCTLHRPSPVRVLIPPGPSLVVLEIRNNDAFLPALCGGLLRGEYYPEGRA